MNRLQQLLRKRVAGIPVPILIVAAAGLAYWWWTRGMASTPEDEAASDALDPTEGLDPESTGLVEPPASVTYVTEHHVHNRPGSGGRRRRCPPGKHWSRRKRRCVPDRRQARTQLRRYSTGGGRGTGRTSTAGRVVSARR